MVKKKCKQGQNTFSSWYARWREETCFSQSQDQPTEPHTNCRTDVSVEMLNAIRNCYKLWLPCRVDEVTQHAQCAQAIITNSLLREETD